MNKTLYPSTRVMNELSRQPLTEEQTLSFFEALENGDSITTAAKQAGISKTTALALMKRYEAKLDAARNILAAKAPEVAEQWIASTKVAAKRGDHRPAKELLQAVGAIQSEHSVGGGITIVIGTPEKPIKITEQIIDVSPALEKAESESS